MSGSQVGWTSIANSPTASHVNTTMWSAYDTHGAAIPLIIIVVVIVALAGLVATLSRNTIPKTKGERD